MPTTAARTQRSLPRRPRWAVASAALTIVTMAGIGVSGAEAGAAAPTRSLARGAPVISVTGDQTDGSIWVLAGRGSARTMTKVDTATGAVVRKESVSPQAVAIAQSKSGVLVLGTANGTSSAVVLYGGATGSYLGTMRTAGPVLALAISADGTDVHALEATRGQRTDLAFNTSTLQGFSYPVGTDAIGVAPLPGGKDMWILRSSGSAYERPYFPNHIILKTVAVGTKPRAAAISPDGNTLYVLANAPSGTGQRITAYPVGGTGATTTTSVPQSSVDFALSADGKSFYDAISGSRSGRVAVIPVGS
jgi:DNA-binding beta-propeller fold protein YncE